MSPLLTQGGHVNRDQRCPLLGGKADIGAIIAQRRSFGVLGRGD